ncbi:unnamed protein product [Bursaphelenchus xylophilus]|uniref:(pine wood nematode) hypothetical protein n=1 Tax=Bursaphelenchus xylophilus TaxID=6326 RepID=A0A1I7RX94_BURXY|nr:unnamed protein product [Bursaphelenchus xylophilus]CAG9121450.1 unnamed protein product [Bursaphelenchus xylophilus]
MRRRRGGGTEGGQYAASLMIRKGWAGPPGGAISGRLLAECDRLAGAKAGHLRDMVYNGKIMGIELAPEDPRGSDVGGGGFSLPLSALDEIFRDLEVSPSLEVVGGNLEGSGPGVAVESPRTTWPSW